MSTSTHLRWSLVVPVKVLAKAKSRLAAAAGPHREALALAVAADTVSAAFRSDRVQKVIVVTDDPRAARALSGLGATIVPDEPDAGLNAALSYGAGHALAGTGVGALSADLPALRAAELTRALDAAAGAPRSFVADTPLLGTTLYAVRPGAPFEPRFGTDSRLEHRAQGAREVVLDDIASVRRDVDTLADLRDAHGLGLGPRTSAVAALVFSRVAETSTG
ncbi:MAG: hypothetical protein JWN00_2477 [Actinomycetia bacterium]|nr:hypothetical protein [Actinomycetes bacterium]